MSFAPGTLVKARGREWVVLPESEDDFLVVRPLAARFRKLPVSFRSGVRRPGHLRSTGSKRSR